MISRLEIKGFKSLADVSIDLGAVNVFIGANGSGKSNLLEAVGIVSAIISGTLEPEPIRYRGVRSGTASSFRSSLKTFSPTLISAKISDNRCQYSVVFGPREKTPAKWEIAGEHLDFDSIEIFSSTSKELAIHKSGKTIRLAREVFFPFMSAAQFASGLSELFAKSDRDVMNAASHHIEQPTRERSEHVFSFLGDLENYAIFSPSTPNLRGFLDDVMREPLGLGGSGLGQAIEDMLRGDPDKIGPFDLDDVFELIDWADSLHTDAEGETGLSKAGGPIRVRIGDRFMGESHSSVSLLEASEGALYVLFMLALVGHEQAPKLFAVDNFDQALHPRLARALTRLVSEQILADGFRQMLATTHNPLVLDGLNLLDDRIRLFAVDRDSAGATQVNRITVSEELMAQAEQGLSLSRLWNMGRLGGVPKYL